MTATVRQAFTRCPSTQHRAGTALAQAAALLAAGEDQVVAQGVEQRRAGTQRRQRVLRAVDGKHDVYGVRRLGHALWPAARSRRDMVMSFASHSGQPRTPDGALSDRGILQSPCMA